jgi:hypothetical protein
MMFWDFFKIFGIIGNSPIKFVPSPKQTRIHLFATLLQIIKENEEICEVDI